jgi:phosphatidate cytidylyltransferase
MSNLALRIISAFVLLPPILALIVFAPPLALAVLVVLLSALAGFEFGTITLGSDFSRYRVFVSLLAVAVCVSVCFRSMYDFAPLLALLLIYPVSLLLFMFVPGTPDKTFRAAAFTAIGAVYVGGLLGSISLIHPFDPTSPLSSSDLDTVRWWVLLLLVAAVLNDTFAYAFGRLFGKRKLAPRISPNKTWAGAFGGIFGCVLAVAAAKLTLLPGLFWYDIALLGISLSIFCQFGDLAESFLKRGFKIKDSGNIIPGHGGILDRCDAMLFGAPVILFFSLIR